MLGKEAEVAVVTKAGMQGGGVAARAPCSVPTRRQRLAAGRGGPGSTGETSRPQPLALRCLAVVAVWAVLKTQRESARPFLRLAHADTWDEPWTRTPGTGGLRPAPELKAPEKIKCFLLSAN